VAQKSKPLPNYQNIVLNRIKACHAIRLDLFVKLKYQSNTTILSAGIKYYVRDLLFYANNYA